MSSEWPDAQLSNIQKTLQNSWQIPYISLYARIFCDAFQLFDFHQEELEDALLSDNPDEIHPFLQELLISLLSGLTRLHVNSGNMFMMLSNVLKRCDLTIDSSISSFVMTISDDTISTTEWKEMGIFEKVTVLRSLCDSRLNRPDIEQVTENMPADSLRFEPFGEDSRGNKLWYFGDTRLYIDSSSKDTETSTWECVCRTLDEWNLFIENFRKTCSRKNSSLKDRKLLERLVTLNTELPELYARKERDRQRRWTSYEPKRSSTRLEAKRQQRLEFEEITQEQKTRHEKFLEFKRRQEETIAKEKERLERNERVKRREERADRIRRRAAAGSLTGIADGSELSENSNESSALNDESSNRLDTSDVHQKVITLLRTNENSWPFLEPVTEELAPNYFTIIENPIDLSTIQDKINNKIYVNNSSEFIRDIELMVANCEQYNGKRSIMGRLANRLLRYFKECWSECQPMTPHFDDDIDDFNPLKRRLHESTSTTITRDKNNNTRPRKNYRQLAGLSDDDNDDEAEYVPIPSSKRARHSTTSVPIYITIDPNSPASIVYHDHSYFIRHESTNSSTDNIHKRKSSLSNTKSSINNNNNQSQNQPQPQQQTSLPTVQVLNRLLLEHQQKTKNSSTNSSITPSTSSTNSIDFSAILRALLAKQGQHITTVEKNVDHNTENTLSSSQSVITSQIQSDSLT
ncbi:unnamed protein product [Adineta steineri]|uniref:Bromo domain-containing protein n=1 Tax=Adineta steineri TaxID=433720 RepID=A0A818T1Q4_9BILA|nr:unnamed protein product [Adineta steineri]CAF0926471.1 unnamed protein product [Adineta steineri]CAF3532062.1 unnamed protein product [Adineta steineri]CAF3678717.1 unnamed protein product [Adineta steineri]